MLRNFFFLECLWRRAPCSSGWICWSASSIARSSRDLQNAHLVFIINFNFSHKLEDQINQYLYHSFPYNRSFRMVRLSLKSTEQKLSYGRFKSLQKVTVDLLLGEVDSEQSDITSEGRDKLGVISSCFSQLCHKVSESRK